MDERIFLKAAEVEKIYGITPRSLFGMRKRNQGPPYVFAGYNTVLYPKAELDKWLKDRTTVPSNAQPETYTLYKQAHAGRPRKSTTKDTVTA